MQIAIVTIATVALAVFSSVANIADESENRRAAPAAAIATPADLPPLALLAVRMTLIDGKKDLSREMQKSLPQRDKQIEDQVAAWEIKKQLYDKNLISKRELENSARAMTDLRRDDEQIGESIAEEERAVSLAEERAGKKIERSARSTNRAHRARARLIRYDGAASWSIDDIEKIDRFFRKRFGRPLPLSALGQSLTHDRLGLDHSEAVDVAARPDSAEGRALMAYLRRAGIPFIAFRGRISRMSTGAHIHIGPPSPRLIVAKRHAKDVEEAADSPGPS
jgi:hypothetical protein